jgi:hypothetical protein
MTCYRLQKIKTRELGEISNGITVIPNFIRIRQAVLELKHEDRRTDRPMHELYLWKLKIMPQLRQSDIYYHHKMPNSIRAWIMIDNCWKKYGGKSDTQVFLLSGVTLSVTVREMYHRSVQLTRLTKYKYLCSIGLLCLTRYSIGIAVAVENTEGWNAMQNWEKEKLTLQFQIIENGSRFIIY